MEACGSQSRSRRSYSARSFAKPSLTSQRFVQCLKWDDTSCALFPVCVVRRALKLASNAFLEALDGYTLGDLIEPGAKLRTFTCRFSES